MSKLSNRHAESVRRKYPNYTQPDGEDGIMQYRWPAISGRLKVSIEVHIFDDARSTTSKANMIAKLIPCHSTISVIATESPKKVPKVRIRCKVIYKMLL